MPENVATNNCGGYVCTKAGFWKLLVLIAGCATFSLYADSLMYISPRIKTYVLASYIISWAVSLLLYFFMVTGIVFYMSTERFSMVSFNYFWSWLSCINFLASSVILACFFGNCDPGCNGNGFCSCAKQLTALLLGLVTAVLYSLEAQNLKLYAPVGTAYGTTWRGIWKMLILVVGGCAFGLFLENVNYRNCTFKHGCSSALTFVLIAWVVAWGITCLMYLIHILNFSKRGSINQQHNFGTFEFFWSAFSCLLYLLASAVFAGYLGCDTFQSFRCRSRLSADICGFVTAILFGIDAFYLRNHRPIWLFNASAAPRGNRVVTSRRVETASRS